MDGITKRFPGITANRNVHLHVLPTAFHAVIGENGAGKSTLLNILYGRYTPDDGSIILRNRDISTTLTSPSAAIRLGIGMVSQHHALIPALTLLENVMLGAEEPLRGPLLRPELATRRVRDLAAQLGLGDQDLNLRAERLSVAAQQKIEILKALYRKADILLLDEPTAMLAPQEADTLFALLHSLVNNGTTIVFVTHKLREVMAHTTAVTVLRSGQNAGDFLTTETSEQELLERMIGERKNDENRVVSKAMRQPRARQEDPATENQATAKQTGNEDQPKIQDLSAALLQVMNLTVLNARRAVAVQGASLGLLPGEIVGIAGVDGSGQRELAEAIVGLRRVEGGQLWLDGANITRLDVRQRQERGIAYIPEDRHHVGMVLDFTVAENYLLGHERQADWGGGLLLRPQTILARAADMISRYRIRTGDRGGATPARALSGGNQQKVVIARALDSSPRLLIACQPTRGLDVGAADFVYDTLYSARDRGLGVLLFSLDLDEVFALSDRIAVMFDGRIVGILPRAVATPATVGALMTGAEMQNRQMAQNSGPALDHSQPTASDQPQSTAETRQSKGDAHD